ncbi:MAG: hypothetical protein A2081_00620 [Elusimicrobia bacterium GWC2_61_19]|nr:MAG: hypothetical protein A2081_00620 [Elusimicrobia bacterium GWC2_61_19]
MAQKRDNCIILLLDAPEPEKISQELKTAFGPERAAHVNSDLLLNVYKMAKSFPEAILILSYEKTVRHQDLSWLDQEDPGFLEVKNRSGEDRMLDAFRLAFFTGAKKAVLLNHLSPEIKKDWLYQALDAVSDKTVVVGPNQDGSLYLLGLTQQNLKLLETPGFSHGKNAETMTERAKKNKLSVFNTPETYAVTGEEALRKWMESREVLPPLFHNEPPRPSAPPPAPEHKKHHKRHGKNGLEIPLPPTPEKPPL